MIKRVFSLPPAEARKIRGRQLRGSMSTVYDKEVNGLFASKYDKKGK